MLPTGQALHSYHRRPSPSAAMTSIPVPWQAGGSASRPTGTMSPGCRLVSMPDQPAAKYQPKAEVSERVAH